MRTIRTVRKKTRMSVFMVLTSIHPETVDKTKQLQARVVDVVNCPPLRTHVTTVFHLYICEGKMTTQFHLFPHKVSLTSLKYQEHVPIFWTRANRYMFRRLSRRKTALEIKKRLPLYFNFLQILKKEPLHPVVNTCRG